MSVSCTRRRAPRLMASAMVLPLLAGCNTLPGSGPVESQVLDAAKTPQKNPLGFRIVAITPAVAALLGPVPTTALADMNASFSAEGSDGRIGPGDTLQIAIFELGSSLFSGGGAAGPVAGAANPLLGGVGPLASVGAENLPPVTVDASGAVDIPYVGRLRASGSPPSNLANRIKAGLRGQSQNPQVLVRITTDVANQVVIGGEVRKPGREPLTLAHEHLLDMIAIAGGAARPPQDLEVRLSRGAQSATVSLSALESDPQNNIALAPGDRIQVTYVPRTFTIFGAAAKVSVVPFSMPSLNLAEAVAQVGGPLDERADPNAVFLFRYESPTIARALGIPVLPNATTIPVIYQLDMMDPTSYFTGQRFAMRDKDMIFIANAKTNKFYKFFTLISTIVGPAITAAYLSKR